MGVIVCERCGEWWWSRESRLVVVVVLQPMMMESWSQATMAQASSPQSHTELEIPVLLLQ